MDNEANSVSPRERDLSRPLVVVWLIVSWLWVGVPLGWGVYNTGVNAMKLFETPAAAPHVPDKLAPPT
jgi:hypothetical protein